MIIQMNPGILLESDEVKKIIEEAKTCNLIAEASLKKGTQFSIVEIHLLDGKVKSRAVAEFYFRSLPGVANVIRVTPSLISISGNGTGKCHHIKLGSLSIGQGLPCQLIAGPCTVDKHIYELIYRLTKEFGIKMIRGGCWKPRSNPYYFPGFGKRGLQWLLDAAKQNAVETVFTEVIDSSDLSDVRQVKKEIGYNGNIVLWIGARTSNPTLMQKLSRQKEFPVMVKNGIRDKNVGEWIKRAEPLLVGEKHWDENGELINEQSLSQGNDQILLCSRGVDNEDPQSLYRFDPKHEWISTAKARNYWPPVGVDPSHSAGTMEKDLVFKNLESALLHKPDFVLLEVYFDQSEDKRPLCDAKQAVPLTRLPQVIRMIRLHNKKNYPQFQTANDSIDFINSAWNQD